jgi:hypothetical protein
VCISRVVNGRIQDMVDVSFRFYKLLNGDPATAEMFQDLMFNRYLHMSEARSSAWKNPCRPDELSVRGGRV